ncbi:MAG: hypothetical protein QNK37_18695 [Acidobacteriota bacterium]|nr:hypothetical protein [Acidobacteriota bacterium]
MAEEKTKKEEEKKDDSVPGVPDGHPVSGGSDPPPMPSYGDES